MATVSVLQPCIKRYYKHFLYVRFQARTRRSPRVCHSAGQARRHCRNTLPAGQNFLPVNEHPSRRLWAGEGRQDRSMSVQGPAESWQSGAGEGVLPRPRIRRYGDFCMAPLMASEALSVAACNDLVDKCA